MNLGRFLRIDGYNDGVHLIRCEVEGAREAMELLKTYVATYPSFTFTLKRDD